MPLTSVIQREIVVIIVFFTACFLANLIVVAVIIKHRVAMKRNSASTLSMNLLFGGLIFGLVGSAINIEKLVENETHQTGDLLCQLEGAIITLGGAATIVGNAIIAMERYLVIIRHHRMTPAEVIKLSAAGWTWILTLALLPIILPDGPYVPQSSGVYCLAEWWGTKPTVLATVYLCALTCVGALIFIGYVYASIALLIYRQRKALQSLNSNPSSIHKEDQSGSVLNRSQAKVKGTASFSIESDSSQQRRDTGKSSLKPPIVSQKDHQIYIKVVSIASGYIIFWGPFAVIMVAGMFGKVKLDSPYCIAAGFIAILNGIANAIIIGWLDPLHKKFLIEELQRIPLLRRLVPKLDTGVV